MSASKFRNRRDIYANKVGYGGTQLPTKEVILIPEFDSFIFGTVDSNLGSDRWNDIQNSGSGNAPATAKELVVGLLNPWNDAKDIPSGPFAPTIAPRTPTRTVIGFNLSGVPTGASIVEARLVLTTAGSNRWNEDAVDSGDGSSAIGDSEIIG